MNDISVSGNSFYLFCLLRSTIFSWISIIIRSFCLIIYAKSDLRQQRSSNLDFQMASEGIFTCLAYNTISNVPSPLHLLVIVENVQYLFIVFTYICLYYVLA